MSPPDEAYVRQAIDAFASLCRSDALIAYPAKLAGVSVVVLGRAVPGREPGLWDSAPYMVIVNDDLAKKLDVSEAQR